MFALLLLYRIGCELVKNIGNPIPARGRTQYDTNYFYHLLKINIAKNNPIKNGVLDNVCPFYILWERKGNQLSAFLGLTNHQTLLLGWAAFGLPFAVTIWFRPMWGHGAILAALAVLICIEWRWQIFSRRYNREDEA